MTLSIARALSTNPRRMRHSYEWTVSCRSGFGWNYWRQHNLTFTISFQNQISLERKLFTENGSWKCVFHPCDVLRREQNVENRNLTRAYSSVAMNYNNMLTQKPVSSYTVSAPLGWKNKWRISRAVKSFFIKSIFIKNLQAEIFCVIKKLCKFSVAFSKIKIISFIYNQAAKKKGNFYRQAIESSCILFLVLLLSQELVIKSSERKLMSTRINKEVFARVDRQ